MAKELNVIQCILNEWKKESEDLSEASSNRSKSQDPISRKNSREMADFNTQPSEVELERKMFQRNVVTPVAGHATYCELPTPEKPMLFSSKIHQSHSMEKDSRSFSSQRWSEPKKRRNSSTRKANSTGSDSEDYCTQIKEELSSFEGKKIITAKWNLDSEPFKPASLRTPKKAPLQPAQNICTSKPTQKKSLDQLSTQVVQNQNFQKTPNNQTSRIYQDLIISHCLTEISSRPPPLPHHTLLSLLEEHHSYKSTLKSYRTHLSFLPSSSKPIGGTKISLKTHLKIPKFLHKFLHPHLQPLTVCQKVDFFFRKTRIGCLVGKPVPCAVKVDNFMRMSSFSTVYFTEEEYAQLGDCFRTLDFDGKVLEISILSIHEISKELAIKFIEILPKMDLLNDPAGRACRLVNITIEDIQELFHRQLVDLKCSIMEFLTSD
ncbi:unnamed protein product [Moneuplotes crassus]|uniref:Uncharacterized protein n=1 Tax=Euplotes crassus TaxID=5936 RepID=A0AAD1U9T5_EUPCR|nr:unnamed protein product [Moneuplotes crassus]